jgi:hypothetical protein
MKHIKLFEGKKKDKSSPVGDFIFDKFISGYHKYKIKEWVSTDPFYYFSKIYIRLNEQGDYLDGSNLKDFAKISDFVEEYGSFKFTYADSGTDIWQIDIFFDNPEALKLFAENLDTKTKNNFLIDIDSWILEKDVKKYNL